MNLRLDGRDAARVEADAAAPLSASATGTRTAASPARALLGPAPPRSSALRGRYRWQILRAGEEHRRLRALLHPVVDAGDRRARDGGVRLLVDVDPYRML